MMAASVRGERTLFFRHWLKSPLGMGAILPSGRTVARAMARELSPDHNAPVLELGGGTGSVTSALVEAGCPPSRLIVVEREPALAALLRRRVPGARVVAGDACAIERLLTELGVEQLSGVVSSLPIKWFPLADQRAIIEPCLARLAPGLPFLQLTNALVSPLPMRELGLAGAEVARIWSHFPPVQIWRYGRAAEPSLAEPR